MDRNSSFSLRWYQWEYIRSPLKIFFVGYLRLAMIIDVPKSHWLVDENRGVCSQKALKNNMFVFVCLMIDGIPAPGPSIFTKRIFFRKCHEVDLLFIMAI